MRLRLCTSLPLACLLLLLPGVALAKTYEVGPGKEYATVQDVLPMIAPGDVVEVQGDHTYPGDLMFREEHGGTKEAPVTVRGIRVNGKRPIIEGVGSEQWHNFIVQFSANNFVFEGFEIVGDYNPDHWGLIHKADNVTLRDLLVHGVNAQGLYGTDFGSGSLTLESSEFWGNGEGLYKHQIYMSTDQEMYPGSVFRMQFCYLHDAAGGNNVSTRSERNEFYYNWIEGAEYHEINLIGPDSDTPDLAREDSDIVGNVLVKRPDSEWRIARIGGAADHDSTAGRYRFVNNTMVLGANSETAIGMQYEVQTLEMHNNVIVRLGASGGTLWNHYDQKGAAPLLFGSHNYFQEGMQSVPASFTDTIFGTDPGFVDIEGFDFRLAEGSPLLEKGTTTTSTASPDFPSPLVMPLFVPPSRELGTDGVRIEDASPDLGAFELGSGTVPGDGGTNSGGSGSGAGNPNGGSGASGASGGGGAGDGGAGNGSDEDEGGGCGVHGSPGAPPEAPAAGLMLLLGALLRFRRRR